jgi:hypothetical protein
MCHLAIGEESIKAQLRRYKVKFERCKTNKRALNKISKKIRFFQRNAHYFGLEVKFDPSRYRKLLKIEEWTPRPKSERRSSIWGDSDSESDSDSDDEEEEPKQYYLEVPAEYLNKIAVAA